MRRATLSLLVLPLLTLLAGCGFHAVYATPDNGDTPVAEQLNQVAIDNIKDRQGQELRNYLIDRFYGKGRPGQPHFRLVVNLTSGEEQLAQQADNTSLLIELTETANFVLLDMRGQRLMGGTAVSSSSFNQINNQYATIAGRTDAIDRTTHEISEQITNRIGLYFAERPTYAGPHVEEEPDDKDGKKNLKEDKQGFAP